MLHVMMELEGWGDLNTLESSQFRHEPQDLLFSLMSFGLALVRSLLWSNSSTLKQDYLLC